MKSDEEVTGALDRGIRQRFNRAMETKKHTDESVVAGSEFVEAYVQFTHYAEGSVVSKTLLKTNRGNITLFAFDKGQGLSEHTAPFDAVVYILDGEAEITFGDQLQNVSAGEMLIMPANIAHALQAKEPFKMLLVMIRGE